MTTPLEDAKWHLELSWRHRKEVARGCLMLGDEVLARLSTQEIASLNELDHVNWENGTPSSAYVHMHLCLRHTHTVVTLPIDAQPLPCDVSTGWTYGEKKKSYYRPNSELTWWQRWWQR